jgi:hypothetical protein
VFKIWAEADPVAPLLPPRSSVNFVPWWGANVEVRAFLLVSLTLFAGWTLVGCYREMRLELKMRNGPLVWLAFLVFMGWYVAGFDTWLSMNLKGWGSIALRLSLAGVTYAALTYIMVLLEPKDRVHYRWMAGQFGAGHIASAFSGLQAWMMSYGATLVIGALLCVWLVHDVSAADTGEPLILAALGFLTRDVSLFVLMQSLPGKRRGDLGALAILFALYVLAPAILSGLGAKGLLFLFLPQPSAPNWLGVAAAWIEGFAVASAAVTRLTLIDEDRQVAVRG